MHVCTLLRSAGLNEAYESMEALEKISFSGVDIYADVKASEKVENVLRTALEHSSQRALESVGAHIIPPLQERRCKECLAAEILPFQRFHLPVLENLKELSLWKGGTA